MKWNWKLPQADGLKKLVGQYKHVLLVAVAGMVLLLWPSGGAGGGDDVEPGTALAGEETFSVEELEERLADTLSRIQGAGSTTVLLTVDSGMERVLAEDVSQSQSEGESSWDSQTVVISGDNGEEAVLLAQYYPSFRGALVVCAGGDDPQVQLQITRAVSALTGLGSDRITVCAGG